MICGFIVVFTSRKDMFGSLNAREGPRLGEKAAFAPTARIGVQHIAETYMTRADGEMNDEVEKTLSRNMK